jgi:hypothetical protein
MPSIIKQYTSSSNVNNGALSGERPQPQKFSPAVSDNMFSMSRVMRMRSLNDKSTYVKNTFYDSSQITQRKKVLAVGNSSLKTNLANDSSLSLGHSHNYNTVKSAQRRLRSSGAAAPAKKGAY